MDLCERPKSCNFVAANGTLYGKIMSANDYRKKASDWLASQSSRTIDYQWEIQHHNQMHKDYEKNS